MRARLQTQLFAHISALYRPIATAMSSQPTQNLFANFWIFASPLFSDSLLICLPVPVGCFWLVVFNLCLLCLLQKDCLMVAAEV